MFIRKADRADAATLARIYAPSVAGVTSFEEVPPDAAEMERRLALHAPWLVAVEGEEVLGYAYASLHHARPAYRWSADVTVYIDARAHRRGLGRRLYQSLFALLRAQGYRALHAAITLPNPASVGLHESFGFVPIGVYPAVGWKNGAWQDVGWWQMELLPRKGEPTPLRAAAQLSAEEWRVAGVGLGEA